MVRQVETNTGRYPNELSADAGYYSEANLKAVEARKYLMRRKLRTKRGRARYKLRQTSVEPAFGNIKEVMGSRQLLLRGKDRARSMWRLQCVAFNLMKLYRAHLSAPAVAVLV